MEEALAQSQTSFASGQIVKERSLRFVRRKSWSISATRAKALCRQEFEDLDEELKVGDEVDVLILQLEDRDGMVVLSHEQAVFKQNWDNIKAICEEGGRIKAASRPPSKAA